MHLNKVPHHSVIILTWKHVAVLQMKALTPQFQVVTLHALPGHVWFPGPRFSIKMVTSHHISIWATPMLKGRRPVGRLFFNMELPIPVRRRLYIETGPWKPTATRVRLRSRSYQRLSAVTEP